MDEEQELEQDGGGAVVEREQYAASRITRIMSPGRGHRSPARKCRLDSYSDTSMSSQRLDEIVAALMKPIKDNRQNFEVDLSLLEDYVTEAGLRQFTNSTVEIVPNFPEVALLIQQSAIIYGRKVDFLFQQVQAIAESFGTANEKDPEEGNDGTENNKRQKSRSKRKYAEMLNFEAIELEEAENINMKGTDGLGSFSMLPKMFIDLKPRTISKGDLEIKDYKGESIGVVTDFRVNWNMDDGGVLCDDLDFSIEKEKRVEKSVTPTNEFTNLCMSPTDSGNNSDYGTDYSHRCSTTPLPLASQDSESIGPTDETLIDESCCAHGADATMAEAPTIIERDGENLKRKREDEPEKIKRNKFDLNCRFSGIAAKIKLINCNFGLPADMVEQIIKKRKSRMKKLRDALAKVKLANKSLNSFYVLDAIHPSINKKRSLTHAWREREILKNIKLLGQEWCEDFLGFDVDHRDLEHRPIVKFKGYSFAEGEHSRRTYSRLSMLYKSLISDTRNNVNQTYEADKESCDDGYREDCSDNDEEFLENEQTVVEPSRSPREDVTDSGTTEIQDASDANDLSKRVEAWHSSIKGKLIEAERRQKFDIFSYSLEVLNVCKKSEEHTVDFGDVIRGKRKEEISRYFFATLLLTNSENVKVVKTDPIGCRDFGIKLLSERVRFNRDDALF